MVDPTDTSLSRYTFISTVQLKTEYQKEKLSTDTSFLLISLRAEVPLFLREI
jgi:hypothetical protein